MRRRLADVAGSAWSDLAWSLALSLAITLPLWLGRGFWLVGDMVFVPHQPWKDAWLGLDGTLPRAVPMDAILSVLSHVVPGEVLQRVLLTGALLVGGIGVGRLTARIGERLIATPARMAAIALFCWNPWVYERLAIGQWAILTGYLLLPWVAIAARRLRADPRDVGPAVVALVLSAVCSPSSGVMAMVTLAVLAVGPRTWWRVVLVGVAANLTWLVPALTATTADVSTNGVFAGFAARAESGLGILPSLLTLGGIWKTSVVPQARTDAAVVLLSVLLSLAALAGLRRWARGDRNETIRLAVLGASAFVVAILPTWSGGASLLETLGVHVPGIALLRDSHRFLAPYGLLLAVGVAGAVQQLGEAVRPGRESYRAVATLLVVAPILLLPGLAWGLSNSLHRASYPSSWEAAADLVGHDPGTTVSLPWSGSYRGFDWNNHAVLDPAPRFFPGDVLVDDRTYLTDRVIPAEDPRSDAVRRALDSPDPTAALRRLGVRWVLVEPGGTPPAGSPPAAVHRWPGLTLVDLGEPPHDTAMPTLATHRDAVLAAQTISVVLFLSGLAFILRYKK